MICGARASLDHGLRYARPLAYALWDDGGIMVGRSLPRLGLVLAMTMGCRDILEQKPGELNPSGDGDPLVEATDDRTDASSTDAFLSDVLTDLDRPLRHPGR